MGRNSLIAIGPEAYEVLILIDAGLSIGGIRVRIKKTAQAVEAFKKSLVQNGLVERVGWGSYKITKSGELLLSSIKFNKIIKK